MDPNCKFITPQRASPRNKSTEETSDIATGENSYTTPGKATEGTNAKPIAPLVTPAESGESKDKQVRFDASEEENSTSTTSPRGLVSRRGGRFASAGQRSQHSPKESSGVEYKTYRSPTKDEVPSLCSTNSGQLGTDTTTENTSLEQSETTSHLPDSDAHKSNVTFETNRPVRSKPRR